MMTSRYIACVACITYTSLTALQKTRYWTFPLMTTRPVVVIPDKPRFSVDDQYVPPARQQMEPERTSQLLYRAIAQGDADHLKRLLDAGADPNAPLNDVETPLSVAITHQQATIVSLLLAHGANPYRVIPGLLHHQKNALFFAYDHILLAGQHELLQCNQGKALLVGAALEHFCKGQSPEQQKTLLTAAQEDLAQQKEKAPVHDADEFIEML